MTEVGALSRGRGVAAGDADPRFPLCILSHPGQVGGWREGVCLSRAQSRGCDLCKIVIDLIRVSLGGTWRFRTGPF